MTDHDRTADILNRLERDQVSQLWVIYHDYSGRASAKTVPVSAFRSTVRDGLVFALANLNMDVLDYQVAGATLLADAGDFMAVPDPRSYALLPRYPGTARMHAWMRSATGEMWEGCPRTRLDAVLASAAAAGFSIQAALEPEFFLFRRDEATGALTPVNDTFMFSQAGLAMEQAFITDVIDELGGMGVTVPQFGKEYGRGQYEMSILHGDPIQAVDDYYSLKETVRDLARARGYVASFMPKISETSAGNSLHVHLSLWNGDGSVDLTPGRDDATSLSPEGGWFLAGILAHVEALTGLGSPTVNSYKRLQPGSWAPANTYWGYGNRSGVIRIPGPGKRRHLEFRSPDNTAQPYLLLAGLIAAGLDGIRRQLQPPPPFQGDILHLTPEEIARYQLRYLPRTLPDALAALEADDVICEAIGPEALGHFLAVKRNELATYSTRVHDLERTMYLEIP